MTLTTRERKALNAAYTQKGIKPNDNGLRGIGGQTLAGLVQRGLLEQIQNQATGRAMYRTTSAGKAELQEVTPPLKPKKSRAGLKTLTLRGADARRVVKPKKA
jgi:hypothetical protein